MCAGIKEVATALRMEASDDPSAERRSEDGARLERRLEGTARKLDEGVARLDEARSTVGAAGEAVESKGLRAEDFPALARRVGLAEAAVGKALAVAREVRAYVAGALEEVSGKNALPTLVDRVAARAGKPLARAVDEDFPAARKALGIFRTALEARRADAAEAAAARGGLARLRDRRRETADGLEGSPDVAELIATLSEIELEHRQIVQRLRDLAHRLEQAVLHGF
jgi:hypothetical protein